MQLLTDLLILSLLVVAEKKLVFVHSYLLPRMFGDVYFRKVVGHNKISWMVVVP